MKADVISFLLGIIGLIVYLIFSAKTEMGTKLFNNRKNKSKKMEHEDD